MLARMERDNGAEKRRADATDVLVGRYIAICRMAKGMSQSDLGEPCGVTFQQIQKYENGTDRIGISRFVMIARALDIEPGQLLTDALKS